MKKVKRWLSTASPLIAFAMLFGIFLIGNSSASKRLDTTLFGPAKALQNSEHFAHMGKASGNFLHVVKNDAKWAGTKLGGILSAIGMSQRRSETWNTGSIVSYRHQARPVYAKSGGNDGSYAMLLSVYYLPSTKFGGETFASIFHHGAEHLTS